MRILALLALIACKKDTTPAPAPATATATAPAPATMGPSIEVVKGPLDEREYAYMRLDNGIQALLIHDPDTDMASAALDVHVGHYADPEDREGLAHFLEHMLFMGTDKYPEVDDYRNFIQAHGGWSNAGTGGESTGYYFQVEQAHLHGAFQRFARFFVAPNLDPEYVDRERNAVNSEYSLKVQDHARRIREVRKATMNPAHPESKFSVGNLDTLGDRDEDTVHARLLELYEREYRPDRMTVAIIGREPVTELKQWVVEELSQVKGAPVERGDRPPPFLDDQLGVRIDMEALDERRLLELQFPAAEQHTFFPKQPHDFVAGLLGNEGEGTLFAQLKAKGWIESLNASGSADGADDYDLIMVSYGLTEEGAKHIDAITTATFDAIEKIGSEGLESWRHQENQKMAELGFKFAEETPVVNAVNLVTWSMSWAPPEHALDFWAVPSEFDAELVKKETLAKMTPENMRMVVTLPAGEGDANLDQTEERYRVKYGMRTLTAAELEAFHGDAGLDIRLPAKNPYLPESIEVKPGAESPGVPQKLDAGAVKVWHLQDGSFGVPRATTQVRLFSRAARAEGLKSRVKGYMFEMLIDDALQEFAYPVREAGLSTNISATSYGLVVNIFGYDDRQGALLGDLATQIRELKVDPERFELVKAKLARNWRNNKTRRPISQASWALSESMDPLDWSVDTMLPELDGLTVAEEQKFIDSFFTEAAAEMLVHGNLTATEAKGLASTVEAVLLRGSKPLASITEERNELPAKELVRNIAIDHNDSTLMVRYQDTATDLDTQARWRMLGQLVNTPFFTELRTEQQLGYVVGGYYQSEDVLPGISMRIQSPAAGPIALEAAVDKFLVDYFEILKAMPEDEFASIRRGLSARLRESKTQMQQKAQDLKTDLRLGITTFDRRVTLANQVDTLNKQEMVELWEQVFLGDEGRLVVRSFGTAHEEKPNGGCDTEACTQKGMAGIHERELL